VIKSVTNLNNAPGARRSLLVRVEIADLLREPKARGEAHFVVRGVGPSFASQAPPQPRRRAGGPGVDSTLSQAGNLVVEVVVAPAPRVRVRDGGRLLFEIPAGG
jgi:hypothetical protein